MGEIMLEGWGGLGKVEHWLGQNQVEMSLMNLMERWTGVYQLSTVTQLLLRWNNPEIVLIQTGVRDIVIFNALLFPSVSIFS